MQTARNRSQKRFGLRFPTLYLMQSSTSTLVLFALLLVGWALGGAVSPEALGVVVGGVVAIWLLQIPLTLVVATLWAYRVDPAALEGPDLWGRRRRIAWERIAAVQRRRFAGMEYLTVRSEDGAEVWISPLRYIDRSDELAESLRERAPRESLLRDALPEPPGR